MSDVERVETLDAAAQERLAVVLAARPCGLFCDIDGTLSAIAPTPEAAALLPGVAELLDQLRTRLALVALVSGRAAADARRMAGLAGVIYIGNHGLERIEEDAAEVQVFPEAEPYVEAVNDTLDDLDATLAARFPGVRIERKGVTGSIHVRNAPDPDAAEDAVSRAITTIAVPKGLRVTRGRRILEVRPPVAVDKGVAVAALIRERGLRGALYLGDDTTDLDAFRALRQLTDEGACLGVSVAVLSPEAPPELAATADITLPDIASVPPLLRWLLARARA
jgi:trehalose 6-phosphate phosphatase